MPRTDTGHTIRCACWVNDTRCTRLAAGRLYAPDGKAVPGGYYCAPHARACIEEYAAKLNEAWTFVED